MYLTEEQLQKLGSYLKAYLKLPVASGDRVPGEDFEKIVAAAINGEALGKKDFVDVLTFDKRWGKQTKSGIYGNNIIWKRAKIDNSEQLVLESKNSISAAQQLGKLLIDQCNEHIIDSINKYNLDGITYSRLIIKEPDILEYFEKFLCTKNDPIVFESKDIYWKWSNTKKSLKKEYLPALHGINIKTGETIWQWNGLGDNQLNFPGEKLWWPKNRTIFTFPNDNEKVSFEKLLVLLS